MGIGKVNACTYYCASERDPGIASRDRVAAYAHEIEVAIEFLLVAGSIDEAAICCIGAIGGGGDGGVDDLLFVLTCARCRRRRRLLHDVPGYVVGARGRR